MKMPPPFSEPIPVTRPVLPPLDVYQEALKEIWDRRWLTNSGPVLETFRSRLADLFQTPAVSLFANGALALEAALTGLRLEGEVVTTPFTFPATSNAIVRCGLAPVFADIEASNLNLDPAAAQAAITTRTSAILAVHVYGNPARLEALQAIADRHGIALVYDAAHAFGTTVGGTSIATFGDVSMFSFHATKPFHAVEGGALAFKNTALQAGVERFANHGLDGDGEVETAGTNAKMCELHALMGRLMLDGVEERRQANRRITELYRERLRTVPGVALLEAPAAHVCPSYAFMPILIDKALFGMSATELQNALKEYNVFTRRYFTPIVPDLEAFRSARIPEPIPNARRASQQVLTLPLFPDLPLEHAERITEIIDGLGAAQCARPWGSRALAG
jgi:dTDP-4-amino-4,6-dideoxygalactose transaminase